MMMMIIIIIIIIIRYFCKKINCVNTVSVQSALKFRTRHKAPDVATFVTADTRNISYVTYKYVRDIFSYQNFSAYVQSLICQYHQTTSLKTVHRIAIFMYAKCEFNQICILFLGVYYHA